jgi:threonine 3-dehydrogenase
MAKLITGGTGYIGAELARLLVNRGEKVVIFDIAINRYRIENFENKVELVRGDLGNLSEVLNVVRDSKITEIYHLGSMLYYMSELNPWTSFRSNVIGTYNVLEAARLFGVEKIMLASTVATFGLEVGDVITDTTIQRPLTIYGCGKLYCEGLGRFYSSKFGLDFRSIRYAAVIGPNIATPGHWAPPMIQDAILGKPHECIYGTSASTISPIYVRDAARAADMILQSPKEHIKMINYNVAGAPVVSAKEIETALLKRYPKAEVIYKLDPTLKSIRQRLIVSSTMKVFDDGTARKEWGWEPEFTTIDEIISVFEKDIKQYPKHYGLA